MIYFLFLLVKIKTVQKTCQFSCFHYTSTCRCETYPKDFISISEGLHCENYSIWKLRRNVLNGNKRPIRYEFYNGVKSKRFNGNMVYNSIKSTIECVPKTLSYHLYFLPFSKVLSMLHHLSVGKVHSKEYYFYIYIHFHGISLLFFIKKFVSLWF